MGSGYSRSFSVDNTTSGSQHLCVWRLQTEPCWTFCTAQLAAEHWTVTPFCIKNTAEIDEADHEDLQQIANDHLVFSTKGCNGGGWNWGSWGPSAGHLDEEKKTRWRGPWWWGSCVSSTNWGAKPLKNKRNHFFNMPTSSCFAVIFSICITSSLFKIYTMIALCN